MSIFDDAEMTLPWYTSKSSLMHELLLLSTTGGLILWLVRLR
jgi:hypothetical protein